MPNLIPQVLSFPGDLTWLDITDPVLDKASVEECFVEHFSVLGLPMLPVRWVLGPKEGTSYIKKKRAKKIERGKKQYMRQQMPCLVKNI